MSPDGAGRSHRRETGARACSWPKLAVGTDRIRTDGRSGVPTLHSQGRRGRDCQRQQIGEVAVSRGCIEGSGVVAAKAAKVRGSPPVRLATVSVVSALMPSRRAA